MSSNAKARPDKKLPGNSPSACLSGLLSGPAVRQTQAAQFATVLAHEVRNPLSNIYLALDVLKTLINDHDQKLYLEIIVRASRRINDLIDALLLGPKAGDLKPEVHTVSDLLDEVLAMTADRLKLKNIRVRKDYTVQDGNILVDKQKIKMALSNIVINAIDAMPPDSGELYLVARSVNSNCIIEIEDNGIGISSDNLQHIFKPYYTTKSNGMGLGLSTTMETLLSNHGSVAVNSELGKGTRFVLSFKNTQTIPAC
jgi:signal transduction histidine kinase